MSDLQREIVDDFLRRLGEVDGVTDELVARFDEAFSSPHGVPSADELTALIADATRIAD